MNWRTNDVLTNTFNVNSLNELTTVTRTTGSRVTVAGSTTMSATNVTVNTSNAILYADYTFARTNFPVVNGTTNFTAIARDSLGRLDTNTVTVDLSATVNFLYDLNGICARMDHKCWNTMMRTNSRLSR